MLYFQGVCRFPAISVCLSFARVQDFGQYGRVRLCVMAIPMRFGHPRRFIIPPFGCAGDTIGTVDNPVTIFAVGFNMHSPIRSSAVQNATIISPLRTPLSFYQCYYFARFDVCYRYGLLD